MKRLAIVTTHPIQYNAPWFRLLAQSGKVAVKVFYTWQQSQQGSKYDPGFGKTITWDIPLLEGYEYEFVKNTSAQPGSHHHKGIVNPTLIADIQKWNADIVLVFGWNFSSHLKCIRFFHKRKTVLFRGDSTLLDEKPGLKKIARRLLLRRVFSNIHFALYTGTENKRYFSKHGLTENQLIFTPHAIDNQRFSSEKEKYQAEALQWRRELGISENDLVVLFAGKLEPKKNPALLLTIASQLPQAGIKFVIAGNGRLEQELKQAAKNDDRIIFLDFQNQSRMPVLYRLGDVFILPSNGPGETWGLAVNEAMACERAVIVSDKTGCAADLVKNAENGLIFTHGDSQACVTFLQSLLTNRQKAAAMGKASAKIVNDYSYNNIVSAIEQLIQKL